MVAHPARLRIEAVCVRHASARGFCFWEGSQTLCYGTHGPLCGQGHWVQHWIVVLGCGYAERDRGGTSTPGKGGGGKSHAPSDVCTTRTCVCAHSPYLRVCTPHTCVCTSAFIGVCGLLMLVYVCVFLAYVCSLLLMLMLGACAMYVRRAPCRCASFTRMRCHYMCPSVAPPLPLTLFLPPQLATMSRWTPELNALYEPMQTVGAGVGQR